MYHNKNSNSRIQIRKDLIVWGFVLVVMAAIAVGDVEQVSGEAVAGKSVEATEFDVSGGGADTSAGERIQFKCREEEDFGIRDALAMLASLCGKNIVPAPNVDGPVAFRSLSNVTFEEAIDAILGESFVYERKGNLIKVYTKEEYKKLRENPDRMIYRVFTLYYITAEEAGKLVKPVLSSAGVMQTSTAAASGISAGKEGVSGETGGDSMAWYDTIVVYDYPENIEKAKEIIKALDVRPKQVLIEATILSATLSEGMQLGIDLNLQAGVSLTGVDASAGVQDIIAGGYITDPVAAQTVMEQVHTGTAVGNPIETSGFATFGGSGLRVGIRTGDVVAFISALESVTDITILANPKILALNKQVGSILIGQKIGYRDRTTIDASGQATVGEVSWLETGTKLSFRPYIGNDGYIRMEIYPQDSSGNLSAEGLPTKTTAEVSTNIMVKDGQTIVIGGLFRDAITSTRSQIPLLGDLPIIGAAFRSTTDSSVRQEVIVLLTPHIIEEPGETKGEARADDIRRKRFGAKESLQWTSRARLAEDRYATAAKYYLDGNNKAAMRELGIVLTLRPTYLEAIRLKERIISETDPEAEKKIERKIIDIVEQEDVDKWLRR